MTTALGPHERYLVVRAKSGWAVNLGADQLDVYSTRRHAREAAERRAATARAAGRGADWRDTGDDPPEDVA